MGERPPAPELATDGVMEEGRHFLTEGGAAVSSERRPIVRRVRAGALYGR